MALNPIWYPIHYTQQGRVGSSLTQQKARLAKNPVNPFFVSSLPSVRGEIKEVPKRGKGHVEEFKVQHTLPGTGSFAHISSLGSPLSGSLERGSEYNIERVRPLSPILEPAYLMKSNCFSPCLKKEEKRGRNKVEPKVVCSGDGKKVKKPRRRRRRRSKEEERRTKRLPDWNFLFVVKNEGLSRSHTNRRCPFLPRWISVGRSFFGNLEITRRKDGRRIT